MDFNKFINEANWKKIAVIFVIGLVGLLIMREVIFWRFYHDMHQAYGKFNAEFEAEQHDIHNTIVEAEKNQKEMQAEMDLKDKEFDDVMKKQMDNTLAFQEDTAKKIAEGEESIQRAFREYPKKWEKEHNEEGRRMFNEVMKEDENRAAEIKNEYRQRAKLEKANSEALNKKQLAQEKKEWDEASERMYRKTGIPVPTYDQMKAASKHTDDNRAFSK